MHVVRMTGDEINQQLLTENRRMEAELRTMRAAFEALKVSHSELQHAFLVAGRAVEATDYVQELHRLALHEQALTMVRTARPIAANRVTGPDPRD